MFPVCHKTIFLFDDSHSFVSMPCKQKVEFDVAIKTRHPANIIPLENIEKTLWTCAVEAFSEYARMIWDIYSEGDRLINFAANLNGNFEAFLSWDIEDQNLTNLASHLAKASLSNFRQAVRGKVSSMISKGLKVAIEKLGEPSAAQVAARQSAGESVMNNGRIIVLSYFRDEDHIAELRDSFIKVLNEYNSTLDLDNPECRLPIALLDLVVVNTYPVSAENLSSTIKIDKNRRITSSLSYEVQSSRSGTYLAQALLSLALRHYNLASTTVTGIPMKEEQNASSSANYDVEIVHPADAHIDILKSVGVEGVTSTKEGVEYETISLKWCTPRTNAVELHFSTNAVKISPVDVNSRPSSCLTNFLLGGKTVMLEMPRSKTSKFMSHMLSSHNDELFIHTLTTSRSILEDPPSISEGTGGRITDYRINDFGEMMKKFHIAKCKNDGKSCVTPLDKAAGSLRRNTLYWPIVIGHSIMFNIQPQIQLLLDLMPKESLTLNEVNDCKNAIYQIVNMESKGTALPVQSLSSRGKGPKREELYKLLWKEVENFVKVLSITPEHHMVLTCLQELHAKESSHDVGGLQSAPGSSPSAKKQPESAPGAAKAVAKLGEGELAWKELERYNQMTEKEKSEFNTEPVKKKIRSAPLAENCFSNGTGQESLLSLWTKRLNKEANEKHPDFAGRLQSGPNGIAPLYVHLDEKPPEVAP